MSKHLTHLITFCGLDSELKKPLENMKPHIEHFAQEAFKMVREKKIEVKTIVPFIGRGLLEGSFTAILFRVDPFRALTLMRFQSHEDFDHNSPNQISIDWKHDLVSENMDVRDVWLSNYWRFRNTAGRIGNKCQAAR